MNYHFTERCEHDEKTTCLHCESGCEFCGSLDLIQDGEICLSCKETREDMMGDDLADQMQEDLR